MTESRINVKTGLETGFEVLLSHEIAGYRCMNRPRIKIGVMMPGFVSSVMAGFLLAASLAFSADFPMRTTAPWREAAPHSASSYHWKITPIKGVSAELVTLIGRFDEPGQSAAVEHVPLVAVLRDTLSNPDPDSDKLRYVYLLTLNRPNIGQRVLSAVPFFYWRIGGSQSDAEGTPKPLLDMSDTRQRVWTRVGFDVLQWTALDPMIMPVRASSHAYRTNLIDHERLHIEEALSFLRQAPSDSTGDGLTRAELDSVIARLTLAKNLLGGLMSADHLERVARAREAKRAATIGRNWELLRTSAERAGLIFEPLHLGEGASQYAVLWFPANGSFSAPGLSLKTTWKLLHISNPWSDKRLNPTTRYVGNPGVAPATSHDGRPRILPEWKGYRQERYLDANGRLLPRGQTGPTEVTLVPLAVYSLTYPRMPLLLVDFRSSMHTKWPEILQRTRDDIITGVLSLSHFTNWYYYAGNALYQFVRSRRGTAVDEEIRLDCYSEFGVAVALDRSLDSDFRHELQRGMHGLTLNPLESSPGHEAARARANYIALEKAAANPEKLQERLEKDRRQELAAFGESIRGKLRQDTLHYMTLGGYTARAPRDEDNEARLDRDRRTESLIRYLGELSDAGVDPTVSFDTVQIRSSMDELASLVQAASSKRMRNQAVAVIEKLQSEFQDEALRADCARVLLAMSAGAAEATATNDRIPITGMLIPSAISSEAAFQPQ